LREFRESQTPEFTLGPREADVLRRASEKLREEKDLPGKVTPSTGVSSEIERRRVIVSIDQALTALRTLRDTQQFWLGLGPAFRSRFEDFQGDLAMLRSAYRE
jgi:hypothetical protein